MAKIVNGPRSILLTQKACSTSSSSRIRSRYPRRRIEPTYPAPSGNSEVSVCRTAHLLWWGAPREHAASEPLAARRVSLLALGLVGAFLLEHARQLCTENSDLVFPKGCFFEMNAGDPVLDL